jgi:hypothetical protein
MQFALALGFVNRCLLLSLSYFLVVNLVHLFVWLLRVDLLDRRLRPVPTYWRERTEQGAGLYRHQF